MNEQEEVEGIQSAVAVAAITVLYAAIRVLTCQTQEIQRRQSLRTRRRHRQKHLKLISDDDLLIGFLAWSLKQHRVTRGRSCWMLPRIRHQWFLREVLATWDSERWVQNFRMSKASFFKLCNLLRYRLEPSVNAVREPLPLEVRVAISLYSLGSTMENRVTANQFHCHKSTVRHHVLAFCRAVVSEMADYIQMPTADEAKEIAQRWEDKWGFPQAYGAIDGTHIPVTAPEEGLRDHVNRKGWPSVQLQAVCDDKYIFRNIYCGGRGSWHDSNVLRTSSLYRTSEQLPKEPVLLEGVPVRLCLLGDPAYPLATWLMKPYPQPVHSNQVRQLTAEQERVSAEQESYNVYHSSGRMTVECAFGRLKGRWRRLQKRMEVDLGAVPVIVTACCILHNFCELQLERYYDAWVPDTVIANRCYPQPTTRASTEEAQDARGMRDAIRRHLANNLPLRRSAFR
ncbi:protein ALP1-like [Amphibalanus amphitrite]|uniref:protein ALP1-like n=1 Tax=Amphibalanus amphitrite TaxID=1232801 RepID=UPI001C911B3A|nr:protein ALP1-like [Amphibalanus amphitrite]XP_043244299.1 protein ALP1-like [Amphibalanus amphitrite]